MKSVFIGSVTSSQVFLEEIVSSKFPINMVFSLDEAYSAQVSGYFPIHETAKKGNIPFKTFRKINDNENIELIKDISPEYIFVIGLSQIVSRDLLCLAKIGAIGFHPTQLPKFRGRAPLVWQILLDIRETMCTLFLLDEGVDSGDIIGQEPFLIETTDYAFNVAKKCNDALVKLTKRTLPLLLNDGLVPVKQNENEASYTLKRSPEDGKVNWLKPCKEIQKLVRAVSKPYPGAFSLYDGISKIIFWKADFMPNTQYYGFPGQIAKVNCEYIDIVCIDGLLRVFEYEATENVKLREGYKFI